jgi:glutathione synthase/RimK-type ligase-like ATP-grasp enzyme
VNSFGILSINEHSEMAYFTEIAKRAAMFGIKCYRFIPSNIHPITRMVKGKVFDQSKMEWKTETFPIPTILYDRCFYGKDAHSQKCVSVVSWLKKREDIYFLGYGLPNKNVLYNTLKQSPLKHYLPSTIPISDISNIQKEWNHYKKMVLKPINGAGGIGILLIEKDDRKISVKTYNQGKYIHKFFEDERKFYAWLEPVSSMTGYLLQPFLPLMNEKQEPFDIRIFIQKGSDGSWSERGRGVRIGEREGFLSNINCGGHIESYDAWKTDFSPFQRDYIEAEIQEIIESLPHILEDNFLPLFELGIDIGLEKNGSLWILDINSKPGRKLILETNPAIADVLYEAPLLYGNRLFSIKKERKNHDAKTLFH